MNQKPVGVYGALFGLSDSGVVRDDITEKMAFWALGICRKALYQCERSIPGDQRSICGP